MNVKKLEIKKKIVQKFDLRLALKNTLISDSGNLEISCTSNFWIALNNSGFTGEKYFIISPQSNNL